MQDILINIFQLIDVKAAFAVFKFPQLCKNICVMLQVAHDVYAQRPFPW